MDNLKQKTDINSIWVTIVTQVLIITRIGNETGLSIEVNLTCNSLIIKVMDVRMDDCIDFSDNLNNLFKQIKNCQFADQISIKSAVFPTSFNYIISIK